MINEVFLIIMLIVIIFFPLRGWIRGFVAMLYSLVSIVLMFFLVKFLTPYVAKFLTEISGLQERFGGLLSGMFFSVVVFIIVMIISIIIVASIGKALGIVKKVPVLKTINRVFGLIVGFAEAILIIGAIIMLQNAVAGGGTIISI